jgi:ribosomal protein S18 acetylase RimI-like enzyme
MLRHVITFAHQEKFSRITLLTDKHNASAQGLYLRHGFASSSMIPLRLHLS